MDYNRATLYAATGRTLLLPGWKGIFIGTILRMN